jgi:hypothetical protein
MVHSDMLSTQEYVSNREWDFGYVRLSCNYASAALSYCRMFYGIALAVVIRTLPFLPGQHKQHLLSKVRRLKISIIISFLLPTPECVVFCLDKGLR